MTGATGHVGGSLLSVLSALDAPTRALVRSPERADDLRGYDVEIALGTFEDPATLDDALRGVTAAFLVSPAGPAQVALETAFIDAAARSPQPPHVVKLASIGVAPDAPYSFARAHAEVVQVLADSGLPHTVLAPNGFMQNFEGFAVPIARDNLIALPYADAAVSFVDVRDIAAVAAHVLTDPTGHEGATYTITGPAALTGEDLAAVFSEVHGRPVRYVDVPPEDAHAGMLAGGLPGWLADALGELNAFYRSGAAAVVTDEVYKATGRPAFSPGALRARPPGGLPGGLSHPGREVNRQTAPGRTRCPPGPA